MAVSRSRGVSDRETLTERAPSDVYTGLLAISLVAMIVGCVLLFLDYSEYPKQKPAPVPPPGNVKPLAGQAAPGAQTPGTTPPAISPPAPGTPATPPMP